MRAVLWFSVFFILKLISCAEVSSDCPKLNNVKILACLNTMPPEVIHNIGFYLDNPYSNLPLVSHHFLKIFSTFPLKPLIKERFNIPEFYSDDIDNTEKELKYLLIFIKFTNQDHICQAIKNEVFNGNRFSVLVPNLIKFIHRIEGTNPTDLNIYDYCSLLRHGHFRYFFDGDSSLFLKNAERIFGEYSITTALHEYVSLNPECFEQVRKHLVEVVGLDTEEFYHVVRWIHADFASRAPDTFIFEYTDIILNILENTSCLWVRLYVPISLYDELFHKINGVIANCSDARKKEYYRLLNLIRFGSIDERTAYKEQIEPKSFKEKELLLLCRCASLSGKQSLFEELLPKCMPFIENNPYVLDYIMLDYDYFPLEMHKFIFDVYNASNPSFRQLIHSDSNFFDILYHYFGLVSMERIGELELELEFKRLSEPIVPGVLESIVTFHKFNDKYEFIDFLFKIPEKTKFGNYVVFVDVLMAIYREFQYRSCSINGENLKLIVESECLRELIHYLMRQIISKGSRGFCPLSVPSSEVLKVLDKEIPFLTDIIKVCDLNHFFDLSRIKDFEQLERLEKLTGCKVSKYLDPYCDYFEYRHIFRYIKEKEQELELPSNLSEKNRTLLAIDFPLVEKDD